MIMKGIFTDIRKLGLVLCILISVSFSASTEEYKSMIRYDRVWEHISVHWNDKTAYYVRFDGAEEINGKTYHRLVCFRKADFDYDKDGQCYIFNVDENYYEHEGYLREESGKVYTLIRNVKYDDDYIYGSLYIPTGNDAHPSDLEERLLYDFTCREGESYMGLHGGWGETWEMAYKVRSIESVEIDGEESRLLRIYPDEEWYDTLSEPVIEGVGIGSYGCLTTINFLLRPTCPCMNHIFSRVLSIDGRVLYRGEEGSDDIPVGDFLGVGTVMQPSEAEAPVYDVMGRRISSPVPGQFYIQNGRKHIAR